MADAPARPPESPGALRPARLRFLAPEVVQTSAMDCGPASLKCMLDGHGVPVSYGRLREACQTTVDGTSISTLAEVAWQLGLNAEEVVLPPGHLSLPEARALPALIVVRLPNGNTHFVVLWRRLGPFVQVMDPAEGRRWMTARRFLSELYIHQMEVPAGDWFDSYAATDDFLAPLQARLRGVAGPTAAALVDEAKADWRSLAALDAAADVAEMMVESGAIARGAPVAGLLRALYARARLPGGEAAIPASSWSFLPVPPDGDQPPTGTIRGAVMLRVRGLRPADADVGAALPPELALALSERPASPGRDLLALLKEDGALTPALIAGAAGAAAFGVMVEAVLFRGLFEVGRYLQTGPGRLGGVGALVLFSLCLLVLNYVLDLGIARMGRRLELRMRAAFLRKIPLLGDRYFASRLNSDMAERSHSVHVLRTLPSLGVSALRAGAGLVFTTLGIAWLEWRAAPLAVLAALVCIGLPLLIQRPLAERDLRMRSHGGALTRIYLDALLGLMAVRTHGAERALRREHESLLVSWARAGLSLQRATVAVEGLQAFVGVALAGILIYFHALLGADAGNVLLLAYWALSLPALGEQLALAARQYPSRRNVTLRLLEPLGAPEEARITGAASEAVGPVALYIDDVTVVAGGHLILEGIQLRVAPGEHVAVVGPSGAGKSSLVGLLLGWHRPAAGTVRIDGVALDAAGLDALRQRTAWVDPSVQLWNRSFLDNLSYGLGPGEGRPVGEVLDEADLRTVLQALPEGMQTSLGEGGALLSGGQGQRVRLGRALRRQAPSLVILDEPFRGLDRGARERLLGSARQVWAQSTLLCITHDVGQTQSFERVIVIDGGRVVEDGPPAELLAREGGVYRALNAAEQLVRADLWQGPEWRRLHLAHGRLEER